MEEAAIIHLAIPSYKEMVRDICVWTGWTKQNVLNVITNGTNEDILNLENITKLHHVADVLYFGMKKEEVSAFLTTPMESGLTPMEAIKTDNFEQVFDAISDVTGDYEHVFSF